MARNDDIDPSASVPKADDLRMQMIEQQMARMEQERKLREAEEAKLANFAEDFMKNEVSERERTMIRRLVSNAVKDGKFEALVYSFPSELCSDGGRAINNGDPDWPLTLRGKAKELFDRYQTIAKPSGYRLKAMILNFPGGMPGDVGFFLNWAPSRPE